MADAALLHTWRYTAPSRVLEGDPAVHLRLTASTPGDARETPPSFFEGEVVAPHRATRAMLHVARVARSRFFVPSSMLARIVREADPVVTCSVDGLRFESFSACAGVYARFDLDAAGLRVERVSPGTTHVDFNPAMRSHLARVNFDDALRLTVGRDALRVASPQGEVVERRVALPIRWLRSFASVQGLFARMTRRVALAGPEARRFLGGLPKAATRGSVWVVRSGRAARLSRIAVEEGVQVGGIHRLARLAELAATATALIGYGEPGGASAWELVLPDARFVYGLSPDTWRPFSGEAVLLRDLAAGGDAGSLVAALRAHLRWQPRLEASQLAEAFGRPIGDVKAALASLAGRGLLGFDLSHGCYFHRALPFALDDLDGLHPRLDAARALVAAGRVTGLREDAGALRALVSYDDGSAYDVTLRPDAFRCTCAWYGRHTDARGPCKHVLAVQLQASRGGEEAGTDATPQPEDPT